MSEAPSELASLFIPVKGKNLLLPNVSVAEVVDYQKPEKPTDAPDYFMGMVTWRGTNMPVVSYDVANGEKKTNTKASARIAVINSIGEHQAKLPFFAIITQGIPRLVKVNSEAIEEINNELGPVDCMQVKLDGEQATIPDLEKLEQLALQNL